MGNGGERGNWKKKKKLMLERLSKKKSTAEKRNEVARPVLEKRTSIARKRKRDEKRPAKRLHAGEKKARGAASKTVLVKQRRRKGRHDFP